MLRRALTADTLLHRDEYDALVTHRALLESLHDLSAAGAAVDIADGAGVSPPLRRKRSRRRALNRVIDELEQVPRVRTPSADALLRETVAALRNYDCAAPAMVARLEALLPAERIGCPLHRAIITALDELDAAPLAVFDDADWTPARMAELLLDAGQPHPLALHFARQLVPVWMRDESAGTVLRDNGPLPLLVQTWLWADDSLRTAVPAGPPAAVARRLVHRALRWLASTANPLLRLLVVEFARIDCDIDILLSGLFLRAFLPRFLTAGASAPVIKRCMDAVNEHFPDAPVLYARAYANLEALAQ